MNISFFLFVFMIILKNKLEIEKKSQLWKGSDLKVYLC